MYAGMANIGDNLLNPIIDINSSYYNGAVLAADGSMFTFGQNLFGQLGDGSLVAKLTPVRVVKGSNYIGTSFLGIIQSIQLYLLQRGLRIIVP